MKKGGLAFLIRIQKKKWLNLGVTLILSAALFASSIPEAYAKSEDNKPVAKEEIYKERKILYDQISAVSGVPWYYLAAIDQYERTMTKVHPKDRAHEERLTGVFFEPQLWSGILNPDSTDRNPLSIEVFGGYGLDGTGDNIADPNNDYDVLYSMARITSKYGLSSDDLGIALWQYYQNSRSVQRIQQFAKIYKHFDTLDLAQHAFPLPLSNSYSYRSTWGMSRSWGGRRIHEGTDLFAPHGYPVRSTCYGVIEIKGWNPFGGWRVGIRDLDNHYHYYAHLSGFDKSVHVGSLVTPGQNIGWVGSSGYGKPGTQGKFPPHLHYGIYRDSGLTEWSFDPYPLLRQWENDEYRARKAKKNSKK
ncbi:M23 family metallopeptidase [Paenibacillus sp. MER 78]|nr:M23 family metallopeptidase [Paenibacillus sp. MER 78]